MTFGERLREKRKACGLTMGELGKHIGVSGAAISRYELGQREPSFRAIEMLANALNTSPAYLQGYLPEKPKLEPSPDNQPVYPADMLNTLLNGRTGENLLKLREWNELTQAELSRKTGIHIRYIRNFEDDGSVFFPTEEDIQKFSDVFQIAPQYILGTGLKGKTDVHQQETDLMQQMEAAMSKLSFAGKAEAVKRVEEMAEIPRYQA